MVRNAFPYIKKQHTSMSHYHGKTDDCDAPLVIIAEAGVNHNGDINLAHKLIDAAAESGANIVKFQTFRAVNVMCASAPRAEYQISNTGTNESQLEMVKKLELGPDEFISLKNHCDAIGIRFWSTAFDDASVDFLRSLGLGLWKIPSGEITNLPYLRKIGGFGEDVILSTGMSTLGDVEAAIDVLERAGTSRAKITLLHCTTEYPAPLREVNLRAMLTMANAFPGVQGVGYSDHTEGIEIALAAVALGATVIEKHFTLDRNLPGPDHKASLVPEELAELVAAARNIEKALGSGIKRPGEREIRNRAVARKSLVAAAPIRKGETLDSSNMTAKRPGLGISPMRWDEMCGTIAQKDYQTDDLI